MWLWCLRTNANDKSLRIVIHQIKIDEQTF